MINKTYIINSLLIEEKLINVLDLFWTENIQSLKSNEKAIVIVRLEKTNNIFITLSVIQINNENKTAFYNEIRNKANIYYKTFIERVEINYNIKLSTDNDALLIKTNTKFHNYRYYRLPITINPLSYGNLVTTYDNLYLSQLGSNNLLIITVINDCNYVELYKKGEKIMEWIDRKITDQVFIRYIGGNEYFFENTVN